MAKKMKSPEKMPPEETAASANSGNQPTIQVTEETALSASQEAVPKLTPPDTASGSNQAIGAAVWNTDKRVNGLYTTYTARNSWMSITGIGWVKLATATDSACEAMTILAAHARSKSSRLDYATDGGITVEMYAW